jgi:hypothetical protein
MYEDGRYFTMTGERLLAAPTDIHERTSELTALHEDVFGEPAERHTAPRTRCTRSGSEWVRVLARVWVPWSVRRLAAPARSAAPRHQPPSTPTPASDSAAPPAYCVSVDSPRSHQPPVSAWSARRSAASPPGQSPPSGAASRTPVDRTTLSSRPRQTGTVLTSARQPPAHRATARGHHHPKSSQKKQNCRYLPSPVIVGIARFAADPQLPLHNQPASHQGQRYPIEHPAPHQQPSHINQ